MRFEWDEDKDRSNRKKHGVSFKEAAEIFEDPFHISVLDKRFDAFEERWVTVGSTQAGKVVVAGHLYYMDESSEEAIRIITARRATKKERGQYEKT